MDPRANFLILVIGFHVSLALNDNSFASHLREPTGKNVVCPDGANECLDRDTCCEQNDQGGYFCCPVVNAVCCKDGKHCCPQGYTCDLNTTSCKKSDSVVNMIQHRLALKNVVCPDGQSECKNGETCCRNAKGDYGCCPLSNAVCCGDNCCPEGYTCDATRCLKSSLFVPPVKKMLLISKKVTCAPGQTQCNDKNETCCEGPNNSYGCCPAKDAVCCDDRKSCCPSGYICNARDGTCAKPSQPLLRRRGLKVGNIDCPDGRPCNDNETCCRTSSSVYGCCPHLNAICCVDKKHCCPKGYTCSSDGMRCDKAALEPVRRLSMKMHRVQDISCPDGSSCPNNQTCCPLSQGYSCCPLLDAVCCPDCENCCPYGHTCDLSSNKCLNGDSLVVDMVSRLQPLITCLDGSQCQANETCCLTSTDQYGCCPDRNAVCCPDRQHCCPLGYTCVTSNRTCVKGSSVVGMLKKLPSKSTGTIRNVICPNDGECKNGYTCCPEATTYGCCKGEDAVCCCDGVSCCQKGYVCDVVNSSCYKEEDSVGNMQERVPLLPVDHLLNAP